MKQLVLVIALCVAAFIMGCGMVDTYPERVRRMSNSSEYHARMIVDDSDVFWMADRPTYLSYWHLRDAD